MNNNNAIYKHLANETFSHYISLTNHGWYVARLVVSYTFEGQRIVRDAGPIAKEAYVKIDIPNNIHDLVVQGCVDWGPFGYAVIFNISYPGAETHCFEVGGIAFFPVWKEISC